MSWARLLKRVFDIDIERCNVRGQSKIIVAIAAPAVIARILTDLNLPARAPPRSPRARPLIRTLIRKHDNGSAAEPTNSLGPRLRTALNLRQTTPFATVSDSKSRRDREIFTEYRAVDRSERWRYSGASTKRVLKSLFAPTIDRYTQRRGEDP